MSTQQFSTSQALWSRDSDVHHQHPENNASNISSAFPSHRGSALRTGDTRMDVSLQPTYSQEPNSRPVSSGWERASGSRSTYGRYVGKAGGRSSDGAPQFDQPVKPDGYLWWYVDALSDCGQFGLTIIAFVGSVFSPYYAWARAHKEHTHPDDFCCLNVALYSKDANRWAMTERGARFNTRGVDYFSIGPSHLHWDGQALHIDINEITVPIPRKIKGHVTVYPHQLFNFGAPLDLEGLHMWGPLAPSARVKVDLQAPQQSWQGHAYLDSNEGSEPIDLPFAEWDWSRSRLQNGDTAVLYDIQRKDSSEQVLAYRFHQQGHVSEFEAPAKRNLSKTLWAIPRRMRSDEDVHIRQQLEDTPFYQRAILESQLLGETVESFHETLNVARLTSKVVQAMLPWRMPRRS
jgi:carotenoid 1,2-hydratase